MRLLVLLLLLMVLGIPIIATGQEGASDDWGDDDWAEAGETGLPWHGFLEGALGSRWDEDAQLGHRQTLGEARIRVETERAGESLTIRFKGEVWYDNYIEELEADIRDFTFAFSPSPNWDLKFGRQVLTWGTGDLVFLNDLFPKDWVSFFAGRDTEYLKAPSNAFRATWFTDIVNLDFAWTPIFEPDVYLNGERFSFFSSLAGRRVAPMPPLSALKPDRQLANGELAVRLFRTVSSVEYAFYVYRGFFHQPSALTESLQATFAPLTALGASLRRPVMSGLLNVETAFYMSRDDRSGSDPLLPNDQVRVLLGYEREAVTNLTVAFQYYLEWTRDHGALIANSPTPQFEPDEFRHLLTNRLTYRLNQDRLVLSLFTFWSPSDKDYYVRPVMNYRYSDQWSLAVGANLFGGDQEHTFFNQFGDNSNVYARFRYSY
jgi:hypothetical protein